MKKLTLLLLLSLSLYLASCYKESDLDVIEEPQCKCYAMYVTMTGEEIPNRFWISYDCSKDGQIISYRNVEHKVRCTQK